MLKISHLIKSYYKSSNNRTELKIGLEFYIDTEKDVIAAQDIFRALLDQIGIESGFGSNNFIEFEYGYKNAKNQLIWDSGSKEKEIIHLCRKVKKKKNPTSTEVG